jgi:hypothetical protein
VVTPSSRVTILLVVQLSSKDFGHADASDHAKQSSGESLVGPGVGVLALAGS